MKIAHLTSAHSRYDTRIFLKMCRSLAAHDHDVTLVVADGKGDERKDNVRIIDVGLSAGRVARMANAPRRILARVRDLEVDVHHLHDPELLPIGLTLQRAGKRVIFDAHEDYTSAILSKPYLPKAVRPAVSRAASIYERYACRRLNNVIAATPTIRDKFQTMGVRTIDVNNYPMIDELVPIGPAGAKAREVCYIGGIGEARGIREIVEALPHTDPAVRLNLAGATPSAAWFLALKSTPGWPRVNALGFLDREEVKAVLQRSVAGLVTLHPTPAYRDSLPVKMFEYMSASLPVIASDFPLWREIIEGSRCGLCVDPLDPAAIAAAINQLVANPVEARAMGDAGRKAVLNRYNWGIEEKKLLDFYTAITRT